MIINEKKKTVEMTKKFATAAKRYDTQEYHQLQEVRSAYPNFKFVIAKHKTSSKKFYKGLTYKYMEAYIEKHDDEKKSIMQEYLNLRGKTEEAEDAMAESVGYLEMKDWFLKKFPAIEEFHKMREALLSA